MTKQERNKKIALLAFGKDGKTYKEIGKMFNISPQRAYDIAKREMFRGAGKPLGAFAEEQIKIATQRALKVCDTVECYHIALAEILSYFDKK